MDSLVNESRIPIRVACQNKFGWPCVTSLWYICIKETIFCATQKDARIVSYLENNPRCGFEIASDCPPYRGIRGFGNAKIDKNSGQKILELLIGRYRIKEDSNLAKFLKKNSENEVAIQIIPSKIFIYDYSKRMQNSLNF